MTQMNIIFTFYILLLNIKISEIIVNSTLITFSKHRLIPIMKFQKNFRNQCFKIMEKITKSKLHKITELSHFDLISYQIILKNITFISYHLANNKMNYFDKYT